LDSVADKVSHLDIPFNALFELMDDAWMSVVGRFRSDVGKCMDDEKEVAKKQSKPLAAVRATPRARNDSWDTNDDESDFGTVVEIEALRVVPNPPEPVSAGAMTVAALNVIKVQNAKLGEVCEALQNNCLTLEEIMKTLDEEVVPHLSSDEQLDISRKDAITDFRRTFGDLIVCIFKLTDMYMRGDNVFVIRRCFTRRF
jgi:hypothetical protein